LDRFGLSVEVASPKDIDQRVEVIKRRDAYENDNAAFMGHWNDQDATLRGRIVAAKQALSKLKTPDSTLRDCAELCVALGADGLRGELTLLRAARAQAAFVGDTTVSRAHLTAVAPMALRHRLRRDPLDEAGSATRVSRTVDELFGPRRAAAE
jgi:magnesium chelatase subunit I